MQKYPLSVEDDRENARILTWIDGLEPGSPEAKQKTGRDNQRKRPIGLFGSILDPTPSKRITRVTRPEARPLAPTSGNTMASRRRSPRKRAPTTPSKPSQERALTLDGTDEETPRQPGLVPADGTLLEQSGVPMTIRLPPPAYNRQGLMNQSSPSRSSSASESSARSGDLSISRSNSPTKHFADLHMAERPTIYGGLDGRAAEYAAGVLDRYPQLVAVSRAFAVIPCSLKDYVEKNLHKHDWPPEHAYDTTKETDFDHEIGRAVLKIHMSAEKYEKEGDSKAAWNNKVHDRLFELVTENPAFLGAIGCKNITTARIQPKALSMTHASGTKMGNKMVDFAIYLQPDPTL